MDSGKKLLVALSLLILVFDPPTLAAAPHAGRLDPRWGRHGVSFAGPMGSNNQIMALAQWGDKIVASGWSDANTYMTSIFPGFAVARYKANGTLDHSFGGGVVIYDFPAVSIGSSANALVVYPDGRVLAAGVREDGSGMPVPVLVRYLANGTLDTSFGTGGVVTTTVGNLYDHSAWYGVALQPDGKIVVAGSAAMSVINDTIVARFLADGTPDTSFGSGGDGLVIFDHSGFLSNDYAAGLRLQPDGKIVVVGMTNIEGDGSGFLLARYQADGTLDTSFGTGGVVVTDFGGTGVGAALTIASDGRIVAAGFYFNATSGFNGLALARYLPTGTPDPSFGTGGVVTTDLGGDALVFGSIANGVAIWNDKILVSGFSDANATLAFTDFVLARYLPTGTLDPSFGTGGVVLTDLGTSYGLEASYDGGIQGFGAALLVDGSAAFVGGGSTDDVSGRSSFGVVKYLLDSGKAGNDGDDDDHDTAYCNMVGHVHGNQNFKATVSGKTVNVHVEADGDCDQDKKGGPVFLHHAKVHVVVGGGPPLINAKQNDNGKFSDVKSVTLTMPTATDPAKAVITGTWQSNPFTVVLTDGGKPHKNDTVQVTYPGFPTTPLSAPHESVHIDFK